MIWKSCSHIYAGTFFIDHSAETEYLMSSSNHLMMLMTDALAVAMTCERARADIVFLVDSSRSICGSDVSCSNWRSLLSFVNSVINQLNIGNDNTRVGFVRYSSIGSTTNPFYLNSHSSRSSLTSAVSGVQYVTGGSFVGDLVNALQVARTQQFVSNRGDRVGVPNVIILLMNGGITATSEAVSFQSFIIYLFIYLLIVRRCGSLFYSLFYVLFRISILYSVNSIVF